VLHTLNAHEEADGTVTLHALRSLPSSPESFIQSYTPAYLHRWTLDPRGTCVKEVCLNDRLAVEFPTIDERLTGRVARFGFAIAPCTVGGPNRYGPPFEGILIDGVVKLDMRTGEAAGEWRTPAGYYIVSEATFVPRVGSEPGDGDCGYLLVFATGVGSSHVDGAPTDAPGREEHDGRASRLYVLDAQRLHEGDAAVAAVLRLPGGVPYGLHSLWLPYDELGAR